MAYTRTPEVSSHQVERLLVGQPVQWDDFRDYPFLRDESVSYVNCLPRTVKTAEGKSVQFLEKRPILTNIKGHGAIWKGFYISNVAFNPGSISPLIYAVGNKVVVSATERLTLASSSNTYVGFTDAVVNGVHYLVVLESGANSIVSTINMSTWATASATLTGITTIGNPVFLNGRIYVAQAGTQRIYNSALNSLTSWSTSVDYIDAEMIGDVLLGLALHKNHIVAFGRTSIEFFQDAAIEIGSPLLRQEQYATNVGLGASSLYSDYTYASLITKVGSALFFVGSSENGLGVFRLQEFKVTRINLPFLDRISSDNQASMTIFTLSVLGRILLGIQTNEGFFVYDPIEESIGMWTFPAATNIVSVKFAATVIAHPAGNGENITYLVFNVGNPVTTTSVGTIGGVQGPDPNHDTTRTASVLFGYFDGGNTHQKHIKYVDIVGLTGNNTVALTYTKDPMTQTAGTTVVGSDSPNGVLRFRNLGRMRNAWFKASFTGTSNIAVTGIEIAYNLGTH